MLEISSTEGNDLVPSIPNLLYDLPTNNMTLNGDLDIPRIECVSIERIVMTPSSFCGGTMTINSNYGTNQGNDRFI